MSENFFYTLREDVKDEESISGNLLVRSGMIKKVGNGIYMYMPLGLRVLSKIEDIIREEMNRAGSLELLMPSLIPADVYEASGRRANFGKNMFSLKDRYERDYVLGPTHEELFVNAASMKIKSYKDMPFNIYQIANKYRDETRPRYGLIRVREFKMKDAYSFDKDLEGMDVSYKKMYQAYNNIFNRMEIDYRVVLADTGVMGGLLSEEYQAVTDIGEDVLVLCSNCCYASNLEVSDCILDNEIINVEKCSKELVYTPNSRTIEEVANCLEENVSKFVKTLIYQVDEKLVACLIKGDRELNETKLRKLMNASMVNLASFDDVVKVTGAEVGFAGPIGLDIPIIVDDEVMTLVNFIVGANKTDYHYKNVNIDDFSISLVGDIKNVKEGDLCPVCKKPLLFKKGIEIGNLFKLGDKYSKSLGLTYLDSNNKTQYVQMGCYGIGLGRILAAIVEQNHDDKGICFPVSVAPFKVTILVMNVNDSEQMDNANQIYEKLCSLGIDVIFDDRDERAGVKFNDADLIGIPYQVVVGKNIKDGFVEFKERKDIERKLINKEEIVEVIKKLIIK